MSAGVRMGMGVGIDINIGSINYFNLILILSLLEFFLKKLFLVQSRS
jgi:hypothetical protein